MFEVVVRDIVELLHAIRQALLGRHLRTTHELSEHARKSLRQALMVCQLGGDGCSQPSLETRIEVHHNSEVGNLG